MKAWLIHQYAITPDKPGITRHYELMRELQRRGHETLIIAGHKNHRNPGEEQLANGQTATLDTDHEVPFLWLRTSNDSKNSIPRVWNMLVFFWRVITRCGLNLLDNDNRPDIIIGCTPDPFAALAAYRLSRHYKVPFVLHLGDIWPMTLVEIGGISQHHPFIWILGRIEKVLYKKADLIISPLSNANERLTELGIATDKVVCVPSSVDLLALKGSPPAKQVPPFKIYYAGRFGPANHVETLMDAVIEIEKRGLDDRFEFHFIGDGPEFAALESRAHKYDLENVRFTPALPKTELVRQLGNADAFMLSLGNYSIYRYGIGLNKLTEYMAIGRPIVLATELHSPPSEIQRNGIFQTTTQPTAIADTFLRLLELSDKERIKIGTKAREHVHSTHDLEKIGAKLDETLKSVLSSPQTEKSGMAKHRAAA